MRTCLMCCSVSMATRWWLSSAGASASYPRTGWWEGERREGGGGGIRRWEGVVVPPLVSYLYWRREPLLIVMRSVAMETVSVMTRM